MVSEVQENKELSTLDAATFLGLTYEAFVNSQAKSTIVYILRSGQRFYKLESLKQYKRDVLDKV